MDARHDNLRKAAILVASLDQAGADALLERMGPELAAQVRAAVMDLPEVAAREQDEVLREFMGRGTPPAAEDDGVELDIGLAQRIAAAERSEEPPVRGEREAGPFSFLKDARADQVARHLARERPQVTALILSRLHPAHAADILRHLPVSLQVEVARRIRDLDIADPAALSEIERELQSLLDEEIRSQQRRVQGTSQLHSILASLPEDSRRGVLLQLDEPDSEGWSEPVSPTLSRSVSVSRSRMRPEAPASFSPADEGEEHQGQRPVVPIHAPEENRKARLAADLRESREPPGRSAAVSPGPGRTHPWEFEDLLRLDAWSLAKVLQGVDPEVVLLALAGARPELLDKITSHLSNREAQTLRRKLLQLGAVCLRDIDAAQNEVTRHAAPALSRHAATKAPATARAA